MQRLDNAVRGSVINKLECIYINLHDIYICIFKHCKTQFKNKNNNNYYCLCMEICMEILWAAVAQEVEWVVH